MMTKQCQISSRNCLSILKVFGLLIALYLIFGAGAYLMPDSAVQHHIEKTLDQGDLDSDQPRAFLPRQQCRMDNFTDAIILNQAYVMRVEGFCTGVLLVPRWGEVPLLPYEVLRAGVNGEETYIRHYGRYWHGNTFLTRYLLVFFDYISIRLLLYIITTLLSVWCAILLWRRASWQTAAVVAFGLAASYAFMMQFSMQFAPVLILALAGMIALVGTRRAVSAERQSIAFFVIGSLTCYFDLLTAPMLTLGLMLVLQAALMPEGTLWQGWRCSLGSALLWAAGYVGTWVSKWIIATLFTSENVIADGIHNTLNRSDIGDYSRWDAIMANLDLLPWQFILIAVLLLVVLAVVRFNAQGWLRAVQLLPIALLPWVWYFLAANHSYLHCWFTFRAQAVSIAAILLALMQFVDWKNIKLKTKKLK